MNASTSTLSLEQFAGNVARLDVDLLKACKPFALAYKGATDEQKADMQARWKVAYVREVFSLGGKELKPEQVSKGKAGFTGTVKVEGKPVTVATMLDRANSHFTYWIKNGGSKAAEQSDELEVPAHILKIAAELKKACDEYKQSRKLSSTAVATVYAAK